MTDIVDRLRANHSADFNGLMIWEVSQGLLNEAADEIERLRAKVDELDTLFLNRAVMTLPEIERNQAVLAEREACAVIVDPPSSPPASPEARIGRMVREMLAAAIRARTGKTLPL